MKILSRMTKFSIRTEQPLWILFLAYFSLHTFPLTLVFKLECALLYQLYAKITIFHKEMFGSAPI